MTAKKSVFGVWYNGFDDMIIEISAFSLVMSGRGDNQSPNNRVVDFTIKVIPA